MYQLINYLNRIDFKLFFVFIIPSSTLILSVFLNYFLNSMTPSDTVRITISEIMFPYLTGGIWIFLYSKVREIFIDGRTKKIDTSNPLDTLFTYDERYMNMTNYRMFVFAAWIIMWILQITILLTT